MADRFISSVFCKDRIIQVAELLNEIKIEFIQ